MVQLTSLSPQEGLRPGAKPRGLASAKPVLWTIFGLMTLSVFIFTDLPILKPSHPLHALLYSQRWLLLPHIAAALTALVLGPLQFSTRLRQRNPTRHRLLGKFYVGSVLVAGAMAPVLAWHYPAFFPYSAMVNAILWWVTTGAAFLTARNRHIEQHRRWMARSYALTSTFVFTRVLNPLPAYAHMSLEANSYSLLVFSLFALLVADVVSDWRVITSR